MVDQILNFPWKSLKFVGDVGQPFCNRLGCFHIVCRLCHIFRQLGKQAGQARDFLPTFQNRKATAQRLCDMQGILNQLALCPQFFLLARLEFRRFDLVDLIGKQVNPMCFLRLVGVDRCKLPAHQHIVPICRLILLYQATQLPIAVDETEVLLRGKKLLVVVLPMDIDEQRRNRTQNRSCRGPAINLTGGFSICGDLPVNQHRVLFDRIPRLGERLFRCRRKPCKQRGNCRARLPGPDHLLGNPLPQHRIDCADQNGLSRTGLTGKHVQARLQTDRRFADDCDILDV